MWISRKVMEDLVDFVKATRSLAEDHARLKKRVETLEQFQKEASSLLTTIGEAIPEMAKVIRGFKED
jgi:hypothetical protein